MNKRIIDASDDNGEFGRTRAPMFFVAVEKTASARQADFAVSFAENGARQDRFPLATPTQALQSAIYASEFIGNVPDHLRAGAIQKIAEALESHGMPEFAGLFTGIRAHLTKEAAAPIDVDDVVASIVGRPTNETEKLASFIATDLNPIQQRALVKQADAVGASLPGIDPTGLRGDIVHLNKAYSNLDARLSLVQADPAAVSAYTSFKFKLASLNSTSTADALISHLYELDKSAGIAHLYGTQVVDPVRSLVTDKIKTAERAVFVGNKGIGEAQITANKEKIAERFGSAIAAELAQNIDAFESLPHVMKTEIADICLG